MGFVMSDGLQRRSCQGQMKEDIKGSQASLLQAWYQARYSFSLFFFFFVFFFSSVQICTATCKQRKHPYHALGSSVFTTVLVDGGLGSRCKPTLTPLTPCHDNVCSTQAATHPPAQMLADMHHGLQGILHCAADEEADAVPNKYYARAKQKSLHDARNLQCSRVLSEKTANIAQTWHHAWKSPETLRCCRFRVIQYCK